jgi:hypothetical protein
MCAAKTHVMRWCVVLAAACVLPLCSAQARQSQSQQDSSVADAARRDRERKQKAQKAPKVITDEDLPAKPASGPDTLNTGVQSTPGSESTNLGEAGKAEASTQGSEAEQGAPAGQAPPKEEAKSAEEDPEVARLKEELAQAERALDWLKRGFALDKDAYYSKADYASDTAGKDKLDSEQQQISDKQQEVDALKARLQELLSRKPKAAQAPAAQNEKPANPPPQR